MKGAEFFAKLFLRVTEILTGAPARTDSRGNIVATFTAGGISSSLREQMVAFQSAHVEIYGCAATLEALDSWIHVRSDITRVFGIAQNLEREGVWVLREGDYWPADLTV